MITKYQKINPKVNRLKEFRSSLSHGDRATQEQLDTITVELADYKELMRPGEKDELFTLVDKYGNSTDLHALRWVCHLLALRHRCAHILLDWNSPKLGKVFVFQVRNWNKIDYPGHIDISTAGHVVGNSPDISVHTAYRELEEELGLTKYDLLDNGLQFVTGYEKYFEFEENNLYNCQWHDLYRATLMKSALEKIHFVDDEVVGIYLCPVSGAKNLLQQKTLPLANGIIASLPYFLNNDK
jgi:8-oxo-dGTP pyrophosphatase MutT (NUDIX family)